MSVTLLDSRLVSPHDMVVIGPSHVAIVTAFGVRVVEQSADGGQVVASVDCGAISPRAVCWADPYIVVAGQRGLVGYRWTGTLTPAYGPVFVSSFIKTPWCYAAGSLVFASFSPVSAAKLSVTPVSLSLSGSVTLPAVSVTGGVAIDGGSVAFDERYGAVRFDPDGNVAAMVRVPNGAFPTCFEHVGGAMVAVGSTVNNTVSVVDVATSSVWAVSDLRLTGPGSIVPVVPDRTTKPSIDWRTRPLIGFVRVPVVAFHTDEPEDAFLIAASEVFGHHVIDTGDRVLAVVRRDAMERWSAKAVWSEVGGLTLAHDGSVSWRYPIVASGS